MGVDERAQPGSSSGCCDDRQRVRRAGRAPVQIAIVAVACTALERNIGARRTVLVALSGQVLATLLTEYGAEVGASLHLSATSPADRPDAGVSYVMFSLLAASLLLLKGTPRVLGISVIVAYHAPAASTVVEALGHA
ncbi:MAG: hypothetical protein M3O32_12485, partial [Actinomycetota bacterium]|nr:hypothetical protein [Actinomycetota bacterium]